MLAADVSKALPRAGGEQRGEMGTENTGKWENAAEQPCPGAGTTWEGFHQISVQLIPLHGRDPSTTPSSSPAAATGACKLNKYRNYNWKVLVSFYSLCIFVPNCFSEFGFKTLEFYGRVRKVGGLCKPVPAGGSSALEPSWKESKVSLCRCKCSNSTKFYQIECCHLIQIFRRNSYLSNTQNTSCVFSESISITTSSGSYFGKTQSGVDGNFAETGRRNQQTIFLGYQSIFHMFLNNDIKLSKDIQSIFPHINRKRQFYNRITELFVCEALLEVIYPLICL